MKRWTSLQLEYKRFSDLLSWVWTPQALSLASLLLSQISIFLSKTPLRYYLIFEYFKIRQGINSLLSLRWTIILQPVASPIEPMRLSCTQVRTSSLLERKMRLELEPLFRYRKTIKNFQKIFNMEKKEKLKHLEFLE